MTGSQGRSSVSASSHRTGRNSTRIRNPDKTETHTVKLGKQVPMCFSNEELTSETIVDMTTWRVYLAELKNDRGTCPSWEDFHRATNNRRLLWSAIQDGPRTPHLCHGPFPMKMMINDHRRDIHVYVTEDPGFGHGFYLGRSAFDPLTVQAIINAQDLCIDSRTTLSFEEYETTALVDTGAGVSCISYSFFKSIGGTDSVLEPTGMRVVAANSTPLAHHGMTPPIYFTIGQHRVAIKFLVVENLGTDKVILGRDFVHMYDVLIDVPQQQLTIRNPDMKYRLEPTYTPQEQLGVFRATLAKNTTLPP
jgi:hypothetical protein